MFSSAGSVAGVAGIVCQFTKRGSGLVERRGEVVDELNHLYRKYPFQCLRSYQETGNDITFRRDRAVRSWCVAHGVEWIESVGSTVVRGMSAEQKRKTQSQGKRGRLPVVPIPDNLCPPKDKSLFLRSFKLEGFDHFFSYDNRLTVRQFTNDQRAFRMEYPEFLFA